MSASVREKLVCPFRIAVRVSLFCVVASQNAYAQTAGNQLPPVLVSESLLPPVDAAIVQPATPSNTQTNTISPIPPQRSIPEQQSRANLRATSVGPGQLISAVGELRPLSNRRVEPSQGVGGAFEETPFSPNGLRLGNFLLFPVLEQSFGFTTNADQAAGGENSTTSQTDGRLVFQSDFSIHELRGELGASTIQSINGDTAALNSADANTEFRFDIQRGLVARFGVNYDLASEGVSSDSIDLAGGDVVANRPTVQTFSGFTAVERTGGRLNASLRASISHRVFGDADLTDGTSVPQDERDQTELMGTLRLGYELSPALTPFVQAAIGNRTFDVGLDSDGTDRDASLFDLRAGATFNLGEKIQGEFALGYGLEDYNDAALSNLNGITINGSLAWSPEQLTTITATAETQLNGASGLQDAGSITYAAALETERQVRANLTVNARLGGAWRDFESGQEDITFQAELGATWFFNRNLALIGRFGYENVNSTDTATTFDALNARVGLRIQR